MNGQSVLNNGKRTMWQLSDEALDVARELDDLRLNKSWLAKFLASENICCLLARVASTLEPGCLPCSVPFLVYPDANVRTAARRTIGILVSVITPYHLLHLNHALGSSYRWYGGEQWDQLTPGTLARIVGESHEPGYSTVLGIASFHRNGYLRHAAVEMLSKVVDGSELPFLLIRQNDWVEPIAQDAQKAVLKRINDDYLAHLIKCLQLIIHLQSFSRHDHSAILTRTVGIILDELHEDALREILHSVFREARKEFLRIALKIEGNHLPRLVSLGLASADPIARLACCRRLPTLYGQETMLPMVEALANDSFMPIRREAVSLKAARFPELAVETWQRALIDPCYSMRDLARFHLGKLGFHNTASFYRTVLLKEPDSLPAIEGLSETAEISDGDYFQQLMNHKLPSRRAAAVRGLGRARGESAVSDILVAFRDRSPTVVREARKTIAPFFGSIPIEKLLSVVLDSKHTFAQRNALSVIAAFGKWRSTSWLLRAASQTDSEIACFAEDLINQWFTCNRVWTRPTSRERDEIMSALKQANDRISASIVSLIENGLARP